VEPEPRPRRRVDDVFQLRPGFRAAASRANQIPSLASNIAGRGICVGGSGNRCAASAILLDILAPAESAPNVRALLTAITGMPILNVIFGAVLAWAAHSSVAVVLLVISLAYSSFITPVVAFALVLGANLEICPLRRNIHGFLRSISAGPMILRRVLLWHQRRRQRPKADALIFTVFKARIERAANRRIAAACGGNHGRRHQAYGFLCHTAVP